MSKKAKTPSAATLEVSIINPTRKGTNIMKNDTSLVNKSQLTMSSTEISELVGSRHDKVKQSIERLAKNKVITLPPLGISENINNLGFKIKSEYYIFNGEQGKRDSIIVIAQLCPKYTARIVDRWQELEEAIALENHKKQIILPKHIGLAEYRKARAMELSVRALDKMFSNLPHLSEQSKQAIYADTINPIAGKNVIPLPKLENKTFSASDVGNMLNISSNMIGRIANKLNLKTDEYGIFVLDKSRSSDKQVETFRYNEKAIDVIKLHLISGVAV